MPSCWIEVDLNAIRHNFRAIQDLVGAETKIIAVVKANAYGHGAVETSRALSTAGAAQLAVTRIEEALPLRAAGIAAPILVLAPAPAEDVGAVVEHGLTACVSSYEDAERLSNEAARQDATARVQLKIDTGMARFGVEPAAAVEVSRRIAGLPHLYLEAVFTHFAHAAGSARDTAQVEAQFSQFQKLIPGISEAAGLAAHQFHCANSAALLRFPAMRLSCVRPGTILYGQYPSALATQAGAEYSLQLHNTFTARARILAIQKLQSGQSVGYGGEWRAARPSRVATLAIGFADGLSQEPQTRGETPYAVLQRALRQVARDVSQRGQLKPGNPRTVLLHGQAAPIIGRIAMQTCSVDVTDIKNAAIGDEVTVFMRRTSAGAHLPRVYVDTPAEDE
ncbi:MAG TPA: alanine racemase [Abditibacteriaceae bacterium]|nr:alanine racemase [Abditibacteriaceae bacterium]